MYGLQWFSKKEKLFNELLLYRKEKKVSEKHIILPDDSGCKFILEMQLG
jgi:hypothetical protein